jgi:hypothetical protein
LKEKRHEPSKSEAQSLPRGRFNLSNLTNT